MTSRSAVNPCSTAPPAARLSLLVAVGSGLKLKVKNAVNYIGAFERALCERGQAPRPRRRRDLRPHPSRRDPRRFRLPLRQSRRLGRELHGGRRAPRRPARDHRVDRQNARARRCRNARIGPRCARSRGRYCRLSALAGPGIAALPSADGAVSQYRPAHVRRRRCRRGAARGRCVAHAACDLAGARCAHRRARVPQGGDAPAHRLVQVPRRLQQALVDPDGERARRRRCVFVRQSRARRGGGGARCSACRPSS